MGTIEAKLLKDKDLLSASEKSLFEKMGGMKKMAMFVEDFMEGIMGDPGLACHHKQFQDPVAMEILKEKLC